VLRCTAVWIPVLLYALAFVVRLALIAHFPDPAYPDSFYYVDTARSLVAGHGFSVDFVWIFAEVGGKLPANPVLPIPSNAHWMPLASIVQAPFLALGGGGAIAAALPFALSGAVAAPLAWAIGRDAGARPLIAIGAGILTAVPGALTPFLAQPDNFGLYEPLIAGALWLAARGLKGDARGFALAGLLVGLATVSRNDGVLAGGVLGIAFLWDRWRAWRSGGARRPRIPVWAAVACVALFVVVMAPWIVHQLSVFGSISPSTASGKVLFIRNIGEWNSITTPATLDWLLGQGIGPLVLSRVEGFFAAVAIFSVLVGSIVLVPFMAIGAWLRRRSIDFGPYLTYAFVLFAFSAIVSAVHVPGGTFIHSASALAPHASVLALEGVAATVAWLGARRRRWNVEQATRVYVAGAIVFAIGVAVWSAVTVHAVWSESRVRFQQVGAALDAAGAARDERVMSIDASGTKYWTGHPGVVLVNDPLDTIEKVARAYDIRWLVLHRSEAVASVEPIIDGTSHPAWLGAPILTFPATGPTVGSNIAGGVYPVCFAVGDSRCSGTRP
jgi:hypothetical protein